MVQQRLTIASVLVAVLVLCSPAQAEKKVALVIGNSQYRSVSVLSNPTNDATEIGNSLERLDFTVKRVANATYDEMRRAFLEFGRLARSAEYAIVFYAGHGLEVGGENWLIPIDAELRNDIDVDHEALGLRSILLTVENASRLGLVILDACRNNPFAARMKRTVRTRSVMRGLRSVEPNANVLVAYAAKDGTVADDGEGRHSPFTTALLRHIETPGLEINLMFRHVRDDVIVATNREQQPFVYGSLSREEIYLKPSAAIEARREPVRSQDYELAYWESIKQSTNIGEFESYLSAYPEGIFAGLAKLRIEELKKRAAVAPRTMPSPVTPLSNNGKCFSFQGRRYCE